MQKMSVFLYKPIFVLILKCQFPAKLGADFFLVSGLSLTNINIYDFIL